MNSHLARFRFVVTTTFSLRYLSFFTSWVRFLHSAFRTPVRLEVSGCNCLHMLRQLFGSGAGPQHGARWYTMKCVPPISLELPNSFTYTSPWLFNFHSLPLCSLALVSQFINLPNIHLTPLYHIYSYPVVIDSIFGMQILFTAFRQCTVISRIVHLQPCL